MEDDHKTPAPSPLPPGTRPRPTHDIFDPPGGVSKVYEDQLITGPDGAAVDEMIAALELAKRKRARWPNDLKLAMSALAQLFPSMRGVPGTDPWDVDRLIAWCNTGAPTSGSGWAARFLLTVWNPGTNWNEYGLPGAGKFDLMPAWDVFDDPHRAAVIAWLDAPFYP
jgi:hypothetical protein